MKKEKSCGAVVFRDDATEPKILLIKNINGGHWSFPKGHVENNETEVETAQREIFEETGIRVDIVDDFRQVITYSPKKDILKDVVYFMAIAKDYDCTPQISEVSEIVWASYKQAQAIIKYDNDKIIMDKVINFYQKRYICTK
ncbi:MAG: NUDIX domain-containing protein [Oscillospiraceae bacterium]